MMTAEKLLAGMLRSHPWKIPPERAEMILEQTLQEIGDFQGRRLWVRQRVRILWRLRALLERCGKELRRCVGQPGFLSFHQELQKKIRAWIAE